MFKIWRLASIGALLFFSFPSLAQENPWPLDNAEWWVERILPGGFIVEDSTNVGTYVMGFTTTQIYYFLDSESTIDDYTYSMLYQNYEGTFLSNDGTLELNFPLNDEPEFRGGFRVDGQQVFFWDVITAQEYLLYDYELEIGEFVPLSYVSMTANKEVVEIDTILINGASSKVYSLEGPGMSGNQIVEGVGSLFGPIQNLAVGFDSSHQLICHSRNGVAVFPFSDGCALEIVTGTNYLLEEEVIIYPNPTSGILNIDVSNMQSFPRQIVLLNMLGEEVARIDQDLSQGQIVFPENLSNGLYVVRVEFSNGNLTSQKVLLQRD